MGLSRSRQHEHYAHPGSLDELAKSISILNEEYPIIQERGNPTGKHRPSWYLWDMDSGRGTRLRSHAHLPEAQRHVEVEHYHSVKPRTLMQRLFRKDRDQAIDGYLSEMSRRKDLEIGKIRNGLEQESV